MNNSDNIRIPKDRKLYGNCQVFSPDGHLMFRCDEKKVNWYLKRNLAEVINQEPLSVKLNFEPKGLGNHNKPFGLGEMSNKCVNCGSEHFLTRHHVVPYCYRKYFPERLKSHNFHDVLSLCQECHENYERHADNLKEYLSRKYQAPIHGVIVTHNKLTYDEVKTRKVISGCNLLLSDWLHKVPQERINEVEAEIKEFLGRNYTKNDLIELASLKPSILQKTHGQVVMEQIQDYQKFIEMWRKHFIENNECRFLPDNWKIDNQIFITDEPKEAN